MAKAEAAKKIELMRMEAVTAKAETEAKKKLKQTDVELTQT